MAENLARFRATHAGNRSVITKLSNEAETIVNKEPLNKGRLNTIATMLDEKLKLVEDLDAKILESCEVEDIEKEIEDSAAIVSRVFDAKAMISEALNTNTTPVEFPHTSALNFGSNGATPNPQTSPGIPAFSQNSENSSHRVRSKLPKLVLPKFNGDVTRYRTFWDSFESAVHSNTELSQIDKFNYLNSLLEGQAQRAIQGLPVTEDNYLSAIDILNQRFGKPQQIISAHMDELLKIPACQGDKPSQLRFVYDKVSIHVRGLEALGVNSKQYGSLLIPVIMAKLPQDIRVEVARNTTQDVWQITDLLDLIQREVEARESSENVKINSDNRKPHPYTRHRKDCTGSTLMAQESPMPTNGIPQCVYCTTRHFSASCDRVTDTLARKEILKRDRRCFLCLRKGHLSTQCQSNKNCRRCHGNHHQSVCERQNQPPGSNRSTQGHANHARESLGPNNRSPQPIDQNSTSSLSSTTTTSAKGECKVLLQTALTYAQAPNDANSIPVRILLDSGSQRSYVTNALKEKLGLVSTRTETLNLNTFGDERFTKQRCDLVNLTLQGKNESIEISALCFPKICSPLTSSLDLSRYPHLQELELADVNISDGNQPNIDILIGSDYYFDVITGEIVRGASGPVAVNSKFGWVVSGPTDEKRAVTSVSVSNLVIEKSGPLSMENSRVENEELNSELRRFWDIESLGIKEEPTTEEVEFLRDIEFEENEGRYQVHLPWKPDCTPKSDGYVMCVKRLRQLQARLRKDQPMLKEYDKIIKEQEQTGIIEPVPAEPSTQGHFLPHHGVIRRDKETTKMRVVFDGSAKSTLDDMSLNDCLEKGPNLVPHLFDTVIKFRGYPIGIVADIEKAFHQIQIAPDDRRMLKFLWFDDIDSERPEIKLYQFRRLPFGLTPSPAILASTIRYHLSLYQEREANIVSLLRDSLYVDDFAGGAYEDSEALQVYKTSQELMNEGGFKLRKWNSNSKKLRERIAAEEVPKSSKNVCAATSESKPSQQVSIPPDKNCFVKFLGINWNVDTDEFHYDLAELIAFAQALPTTKRSVLRLSAKIFDPMGLVTPFTINTKILFQSLCTTGVDWDDKLEGKALASWNSFVNDLRALNDVRVPRCYFHCTGNDPPRNHQIHGFCDASDKAFAAAVYLRTEHSNGDVEISLIASKTRVAPIKKQSIPRLELLGALILARLIDSILNAITSLRATPSVVLWTDSFTALCWIRNDKAWKQYIQQRVKEIRALTNQHQWRHCPGELNPADLPSRGCSGRELVEKETWWKGPNFLKCTEEQWPQDPQPTSKDVKEHAFTELVKHPPKITHSLVGLSISSENSIDLEKIIDHERYSTKTKLLRVTATVLRFTRILRHKGPRPKTIELSADEMLEAEKMWIKCIQASQFQTETRQLLNGGTNQMVKQLGLFMDEDNIIRCEGRISQSSVPEAAKQPILLPAKHRFTELVIRERHEIVHHNGIRETLNCVREKYWIPRGRETVKRVVRHCVTCKKFEGRAFTTPRQPPLPPCRVSEDPPFANTGIDFAGPLYTTSDNSAQKVYICLFTCASTRAVHLELVESLSVPTFLQAFRRFAARRGLPARLLSDNAKTFKSAAKEMKTITRSAEVQRYLATKGVTWDFIIEKAPWHGGFWERMIQSTKRCLRKALGRTSLSFEALRTLLVEIETTLNNRPLTYVYDDEEGISYPLTPSHLISGRRIATTPSDRQFEIISTNQSLTKRALYQKRLLTEFTKQWRKEYLLSIREASSTLHGPTREKIAVGHVVILKNDSVPRAFWKLATVQELHRSNDGIVRSARVRVISNDKGRAAELRRPIQHLIPLELQLSAEPTPALGSADATPPSNDVTTGNRPRRTAAVIGELLRKQH